MTDIGDRLAIIQGEDPIGVTLSEPDVADRLIVIQGEDGDLFAVKTGNIDIGDRVIVVQSDRSVDNVGYLAFSPSAASTYWVGPTGATGYCNLKLCSYDFSYTGTVWAPYTQRKFTLGGPTVTDSSDPFHRDIVSSDCWAHYFRNSEPTEYYMISRIQRIGVIPPPNGNLSCYNQQYYLHFDIKGDISTGKPNSDFLGFTYSWGWPGFGFSGGGTIDPSLKTDSGGNWSSPDWVRKYVYIPSPAPVLTPTYSYYDLYLTVVNTSASYKVTSANIKIAHMYITTYSS